MYRPISSFRYIPEVACVELSTSPVTCIWPCFMFHFPINGRHIKIEWLSFHLLGYLGFLGTCLSRPSDTGGRLVTSEEQIHQQMLNPNLAETFPGDRSTHSLPHTDAKRDSHSVCCIRVLRITLCSILWNPFVKGQQKDIYLMGNIISCCNICKIPLSQILWVYCVTPDVTYQVTHWPELHCD